MAFQIIISRCAARRASAFSSVMSSRATASSRRGMSAISATRILQDKHQIMVPTMGDSITEVHYELSLIYYFGSALLNGLC
jgi:hypothetical protein